MNKPDAIEWCNNFLQFWPKNCKHSAPTGWRWVVHSSPYKLNEYVLISIHKEDETITQNDVKVKA